LKPVRKTDPIAARDEQQLNIDSGNAILIQRFAGVDLVVCGKGE
jgi:hypothetical protein